MEFIFKLGALLRGKDPRNIQLRHYLKGKTKLPDPQKNLDWVTSQKHRLHLWANDKYGCCVFAAKYNFSSVVSGLTDDPFFASDADVLRDYAAVTGFDPKTGANDNGANPEDALRYYSKLPEGDPRRIIAWGEVDHHNMREVRQALQIFGGIYTAIALPKTIKKQTGEDKMWDVVNFPTPDRIPNSLGGHMTETQKIDASKRDIIIGTDTWGFIQPMTKRFWDKYVFVTYFYIDEKWIADNSGKTPSGFDLETLLANVEELKAA